jgi:hypothetical protein
VPGRLAIATVLANAIFAFVTGVSIAAAAAFSRIAWPEMKRHGYERKFALGCIAGSACLGMLIPPSVLMIVWGVLTEQAIGKLFIAGIIPGFVVVAAYCTYILYIAYTQPHRVGEGVPAARAAGAAALGQPKPAPQDDRNLSEIMISTALVVALVLGVLGGIWLGAFTPTEGAGVGAAASLLLAIAKGVRPKEIFEVILTVGRTSAPLLLLLVFAQLYSRVLSMTGVTGAGKGPVPQFRPRSLAGARDHGADLVRARLPDRLHLHHPAHRAGLRPDRRGARLRSDRLRHPRHPRHRDRPADAALRHARVHRQGRLAAGEGNHGRDLRRLGALLDLPACGDRYHRRLSATGDVAAQSRPLKVAKSPPLGQKRSRHAALALLARQ